MFIQTWGEVFSASLQGLWLGFINFVPSLILAIIIFISGWVVGSVVGRALAQVIDAIKIDKLFESIGVTKLFEKAGFKFSFGVFLGELVKWFIIIVFLMTSLEVLGLSQVNAFLSNVFLLYLPQLIIAALILVIAGVVANAMKKVIEGSAMAMGMKSARFAGSIAKWAIWIFAFIIALSELGIAPAFMQILFTGIVAMLAIAGGLAFGLGGKDSAGKAIEKISDAVSHR